MMGWLEEYPLTVAAVMTKHREPLLGLPQSELPGFIKGVLASRLLPDSQLGDAALELCDEETVAWWLEGGDCRQVVDRCRASIVRHDIRHADQPQMMAEMVTRLYEADVVRNGESHL